MTIKKTYLALKYILQKGPIPAATEWKNALGVEHNIPGLHPHSELLSVIIWVSRRMPGSQFPHPSNGDKHSSQGCVED